MADDGPRSPQSDYSAARVWSARVLVLVLVVYILLDPFVPGFDVNPFVVGGLLGALCALLGIEYLPRVK